MLFASGLKNILNATESKTEEMCCFVRFIKLTLTRYFSTEMMALLY